MTACVVDFKCRSSSRNFKCSEFLSRIDTKNTINHPYFIIIYFYLQYYGPKTCSTFYFFISVKFDTQWQAPLDNPTKTSSVLIEILDFQRPHLLGSLPNGLFVIRYPRYNQMERGWRIIWYFFFKMFNFVTLTKSQYFLKISLAQRASLI